MRTDFHYLDCNATAPLRPEAQSAMASAMAVSGNPSSVHGPGRAARAVIERAREQVAAMVGVPAAAVHFTASGTEANNWALASSGRAPLAMASSHDSVLRAVERAGGEILAVDGHGLLDPAELGRAMDEADLAIVSVVAVNNETGVIQPLAAIAEICRDRGALLHIDAVQAPGRIDMTAIASAGDLISLSAHKLGGPAGAGALLVRERLDLDPLIVGGGQEKRRRAGTENLIGIAGFGAAAEAVAQEAGEAARLATLRDRLERRLSDVCEAAEIIGRSAERAPNTTCVRMPGVPAETQLMALDLAGVATSAGAACSSGKVQPSHVLRAMGFDEEAAGEAIRISTGWTTTEADIDALLAAWEALWRRKTAA
ncbi:MAG: hypothetical protein TEF_11575 [Rhizobiales bacterium NRL2]|jgi:cysteine desulfurase|nr:MAG: hypothetical protein TEF_11575 [Rhizobiales bacterium NRL2]